MNEQLYGINPIWPDSVGSGATISYYFKFCSFNTNPYGRVHALAAVIIHAAGRIRKTPRPLN